MNKRRDFLKFSGLSAGMLAGQGSLFAKTDVMSVENGMENYPNESYTESMYANEFDFTRGNVEDTGYAYHCINCQGNCSWEVWGNNGVVTRENQSAKYPIINSKIPDFNPRGCNKGVQHSQVMYEKDRILYPMKRVGKRGEGKWKRVSWDDAAEEVAQKIFDVMTDEKRGPDKLMVHAGTGLLTEGRRQGPLRFSTMLGANRIYPASYLGDMFSGATIAYGEPLLGCTWDFQFNTDVQVYWGANPSVSRIPDAHFAWEGKYNGSKVIVITPEFNASAKSADLWVPIKPGTDNFLAASVIHEILANKLYKPNFVKQYTDLPILVRKDNKKMVKKSDIEGKQSKENDQQFYCMNANTGEIELMHGSKGSEKASLRLDEYGIDPILEGQWDIEIGGETVTVTTVFEMLKENIKDYSPEATAAKTGVSPKITRQLAREMALPKVVSVTTGFSLNKYFNGIMSLWNISSICGLTGRLGPYGGLNTENELALTGMSALGSFNGKYSARFGSGFVGEFVFGDGMKTFDKYFSDEDVKRAQNGLSKKEYMEIVEDMLAKGKNGGDGKHKPWWEPDVAVIVADSKFRRNKGSDYREAFLNKISYFAYVDYRMSDTAVYADLLLPAKSHYEVHDIRSTPGYHRFTNLAQPLKNFQSVGEAMEEWSMFSLIAKKLQELAKRPENIDKAKVPDDEQYAKPGFHDLTICYDEFTNTDMDSKLELEPELGTDKLAVEAALENVEQYKPWTREKMYAAGGFLPLNEKAATNSPLYPNRPFNSNEYHLFKHEPFKTVTGRQTFYVDEDMFIKMGAHTNTAMDGILSIDPKNYPFQFLTPHARWSIHSNYKSSRTLQRLQRGVPYVQVNNRVCEKMGVKDGETIRIYNALGEFYAMVKASSSCPADGLVMEHGWEPYMYKFKKGHNEVVPTSLNVLELVDNWGHLNFGGYWDGNQYAYDGAVNIEKAEL
ncbi:MAG: molybdopterin-dependent oxidoreductase [Campylobacterota bacterium]